MAKLQAAASIPDDHSEKDAKEEKKRGSMPVIDMKKKKNEENKDSSFGITEQEFCNIHFDLDWPYIIKDLALYLTGMDILKGTKISEAEEYQP